MRFEDMKNNIPETPEFIHEMIQSEVEKQLQNTEEVNIQAKRVKKWTGVRVAVVAAVCLLATSTVAYGGVELYHMYLEKQGTYSVVTGIKAEDGAGEMYLPKEIHNIEMQAGYIPEGMEWMDGYHLSYPEHSWNGGFSFRTLLLDDNDLDKVMQHKSVVDCEERNFGNYKGIYLKYHDLAEDYSFDQRIYLFCPDLYRVIMIYIGDDVTKEDAVKVVENLKITENDTIIKTAGMDTWSREVSHEIGFEVPMITSVGENELPVHQVGDTFDLSVCGEDSNGQYIEEKISVCVDSVQKSDDLGLLGNNPLPEGWTDAIGADGKLVNNTLSYIKAGDGIDSLDEIVKTESVKQKLVYATVTYTNNSDQEIDHMLYIGTLLLMNHDDGRYQICESKVQSGDEYDYVIQDGVARTGGMTYNSVSEDYGNGGNYIPSLKPGESIQLNMAWIVNENDLENMYLNLDGGGAAYEFTDSILKTGLVDIRQ